jgi:threonine/homoserine/homoserine lactone efflux protein
MNLWALFIQGLGLGFSIAAPVGPIGVLCIQRTLKKGFPSGFFSGMGAASADLLYGALAAFGALWLGSNLVQFQVPLRVVGGLVLIFMGIRAFLQQQTQEQTPASDKRSLLADYGSTFLLTLTNPITIFSFTAMYAGLGFSEGQATYTHMAWMVLGVFCGSACWWLLLSSLVSLLRGRLKPLFYTIINKAAGLILVGFGVSLIAALFQG